MIVIIFVQLPHRTVFNLGSSCDTPVFPQTGVRVIRTVVTEPKADHRKKKSLCFSIKKINRNPNEQKRKIRKLVFVQVDISQHAFKAFVWSAEQSLTNFLPRWKAWPFISSRKCISNLITQFKDHAKWTFWLECWKSKWVTKNKKKIVLLLSIFLYL